jgi:hypothetical protein
LVGQSVSKRPIKLRSPTWEVEIRRIVVQFQSRQKVWETPSQSIKLGMVVCTYLPSHRKALIKGSKSRLAQAKM